MKKHIILTILAAAGMLISSCTGFETVKVPGNGFTLKLDSGSMTTKADGDVSFEDAVNSFDYFFFDDENGTTPTPGLHAHVNASSVTLDTSTGDYAVLATGTHYVYILANYPERIDHSSDKTLEDLLAMEFISNLMVRSDSEGNVTFADNLVMDSYNASTGKYLTELTPRAIQEQRVETVYLSRIAAKLTFTIKVKDKVQGTMEDTWTPILKDLKAYFVNALNNKASVSGEPTKRPEPETISDLKYITYPESYNYTQDASDEYTFVTDPFYTYPQTWNSTDNGEPYLKIALPWYSNKRGTTNLYYKVNAPKPENGKWTLSRNCWYNVSVELSIVDSTDDYIIVDPNNYTIHPWSGSANPGGSPLSSARFFDVPNRSFTIFSLDSLAIPFSSSSTIEAYFTEISFDYYGDRDTKSYTFTFSEEDKRASLTVPTSYNGTSIPAAGRDNNLYSLAVEGKSVVFRHSLANIFTVRNIVLVLQQKDNTSNRAVITITQHPAIEMIKRLTNSMFVNGYFGHVAAPVDGNGEPFARRSSNQYTWQYAQYNPDLPSVYYHSSNNTATNGTTLNQNGTFNFTDNATGWGSVYGNTGFDSTISTSPFLTEVVVSAFNETNDKYTIRYGSEDAPEVQKEYRIGDPRKTAGSQGYSATWLADYLFNETYSSNGTVTEHRQAWQEPLNVLIASQQASDREVIAPRFLISSALNVTGGVRWYGAVRRAATYQEAGYPAGRWRLPTEAEIAFIMARQQEGSLPTLFANTSIYWSADGRVLKGQKNHPIVSYARPGTEGADESISLDRPLRFVYDLWYWGDVPDDSNMYHPNGHIIPYTTN